MLYPSAKVIVRSTEKPNMILLIKRMINDVSYYEPAGGKVEVDFTHMKSESLEECAKREIAEELGVSIDIKNYIGSYYFFWSIDPKKLSTCAVFEGSVICYDPFFADNKDSCELPFSMAWVSIDDVLNGCIIIDPLYVGLEDLIKNYCKRNRISES